MLQSPVGGAINSPAVLECKSHAYEKQFLGDRLFPTTYPRVTVTSIHCNVPCFALAFSIIAGISALIGCDSHPTSRDPQLANGWVTNCSGADFAKLARTNQASPSGARPVFKINNQLVLAVPKEDWPSAGRIESEPRECRSIGDLPSIPYLYFVIKGNWSGDYQSSEIPVDGGRRRFLPDAVTVRLEPESRSILSSDDRHKIELMSKDFWDNLMDKQELGGLTCGKHVMPLYSSNGGGLFCLGHRSPSDPDTVKLSTDADNTTPFLHIDADYSSSHYGGIHVYWQAWTRDVSHGVAIDKAIWSSLAEWNLVDQNVVLNPIS